MLSTLVFCYYFREVGETGGYEHVDNSHPSHEVSAKMTLHNLRKFTTYQIIVQAYNKEGVGPTSNTLVATTMEDGEKFAINFGQVPNKLHTNFREIQVICRQKLIDILLVMIIQ